jgi:putative membrane protein
MMHWSGCGVAGWGGHWLGGLLMLLFWLLVMAGIAVLVRGIVLRSPGGSAGAAESPLEILKRRYAKGEIDKAEFEEKRKDLLGS